MSKDLRQKALVLFNFANLSKKQQQIIVDEVKKKYPQHEVYADARYFKKHKYDYNWFSCTIEPVIGGVSVLHRMATGIRQVLFVDWNKLEGAE